MGKKGSRRGGDPRAGFRRELPYAATAKWLRCSICAT